jgi:hypothetical protein
LAISNRSRRESPLSDEQSTAYADFTQVSPDSSAYEYTEERQAIIQEQRAAKKTLRGVTVRIYVARTVAAVIWVLAVWKLISAILAPTV